MRRHKGRLSTFHGADKRKKSQLRLITTEVMKETEGDRKERKSLLFLTWEKVERSTASPPKLNPAEGDEGRLIWWTWRWLVDARLSCLAATEWKIKSVSQSNEAKCPQSFSVSLWKSDCDSFIQAAPERFNLARISLTLRCLRQIKAGREVGADPGRFFPFCVVAAGIVSKDLMSLCPGVMLRLVINKSYFSKDLCVCSFRLLCSAHLKTPKSQFTLTSPLAIWKHFQTINQKKLSPHYKNILNHINICIFINSCVLQPQRMLNTSSVTSEADAHKGWHQLFSNCQQEDACCVCMCVSWRMFKIQTKWECAHKHTDPQYCYSQTLHRVPLGNGPMQMRLQQQRLYGAVGCFP